MVDSNLKNIFMMDYRPNFCLEFFNIQNLNLTKSNLTRSTLKFEFDKT